MAQGGGEPLCKRGLAAAGGLGVRAEQCAELNLRVLGLACGSAVRRQTEQDQLPCDSLAQHLYYV